MQKVKYRVYMQHKWGGNPIALGLYEDVEVAKDDVRITKDEMFTSWYEEEVLEGEK